MVRALILAGGLGKRLRPVTDYLPKPLVPVLNVPILGWQLRHLGRHGIRDVTVCAGYKASLLADYARRAGRGMRVDISEEKSPLGTAGAAKRAARGRRGPFIIMNGDVITDIDLGEMLDAPRSVAAVPLRSSYGVLDLDGPRVAGFGEKGQVPGSWMNAGVYNLDAGAVRDMPARGDLERTLFPSYAGRGLLSAVRFRGAMWHSIDSFKDLEECAASLSRSDPGRRSGRRPRT